MSAKAPSFTMSVFEEKDRLLIKLSFEPEIALSEVESIIDGFYCIEGDTEGQSLGIEVISHIADSTCTLEKRVVLEYLGHEIEVPSNDEDCSGGEDDGEDDGE